MSCDEESADAVRCPSLSNFIKGLFFFLPTSSKYVFYGKGFDKTPVLMFHEFNHLSPQTWE